MNGGPRARAGLLAALLLPLALAACGGEAATLERADEPAATVAPTTATAETTTTTAPTTTAPPPTTVPTTLPPPTTLAPPTTMAVPRVLVDTGFSPFATISGLVLSHPAAQVEVVGFHESSHDGARQMDPSPQAARPVELESRQRGTGSRTAADIVVSPDAEIRSPITGTVLRAGSYVLYCKHQDSYAVIDPDVRPGWEVKVLHVDGLQVQEGQRVEAGVTVIASRPTQLPFASQVDDHTARPAWPHVHVEVVDPTIPDRPSPDGSDSC